MPTAYMVDRDTEGLRIAFGELLEEGFQRGKIERAGGAGSEDPARAGSEKQRRAQLLDDVERRRTLTVGYYTFAAHIFRLDAERATGLPLDPRDLAHFEGTALRTLATARTEHRVKHPACSRCGTEQETRFHPKCTNCSADFTKKGKK